MSKPIDTPPGVRVRGGSLQIYFTYKGVRCYETLHGLSRISKSAIAYADNKLRVIKAEIKEGRFDYAAHFPGSERARMFSGWGGKDINRTVGRAVDTWLSACKETVAASTYKGYFHKAQHILSHFGRERKLSDISNSDLKLFRGRLLKDKESGGKGLSTKTVNDIFTVARGIFDDAFEDGSVQNNPVLRIKNLATPNVSDEADPFSREELARIEESKIKPQLKNLIMFCSWTGLSVSEYMALAWEDVDLVAGKIKVSRARVNEEFKVPKETSRERFIELIAPALGWLRKQKEHTFMLEQIAVSVRQRDNVKLIKEQLRFVFINDVTGDPWHQASIARQFAIALRQIGIRHRGPNQCRHTFASQCLSSYIDLDWIARQLGHTDTNMIKKHYGRWIPKDTKSLADEVSDKLGFGGTEKAEKGLENVKIVSKS